MNATFDKSQNEWRLEGGIEVRFLQMVAKYLNKSIKYLDSNGIFGTELPNGSWTGAVGHVLSGRADIGAGGLIAKPSRYNVVDFSKTYFVAPITFVTPAPHQVDHHYVIFQPFTVTVWLFTGLALLLFTAFICKMNRISLPRSMMLTMQLFFTQKSEFCF